jgi:hypothetical protein
LRSTREEVSVVRSLTEELVITRNRMLDIPPLFVLETGELIRRTEIRMVGTAWDS